VKKQLTADEFYVPAHTVQAEIKVRGSKFIATIDRVANADEAETVYAALRKKYYNATHNCFAWRIDDQQFRYSDDGEPSGTAGRPILQVIDGTGLKQILCTVTRYFGGTKLGTGGLIRAYSDAAAAAFEQVDYCLVIRTIALKIELKYEQEPLVRRLIDQYGGKILDSRYAAHINLEIALPQSLQNRFQDEIRKATHSSIKIVAL